MTTYPELTIPDPALFIGGQWRPASGGETRPVTSPVDGKQYAEIAWATVDDVNDAVTAARSSFDSGQWAGLSGRERSRVLLRVAQLIRDHADELAWLESADTGKPIPFTRRIDVGMLSEHYDYVASLAQHLDGAVREIPGQLHAYTRREPVGVVAAISPFNFPLILSNTKIAVALAAGNSIVLKPATETPMSALLMARLLQEAGVPDGVVNVVTGSGSTIGDTLTGHDGVNKVGFTGSTGIGAHIAERSGGNLKRMTAELGGNAANIIFDDANLDTAARTAVDAFLFNAGQFCMAGPRLIVRSDVYDEVLDRITDLLAKTTVGHPADEATEVGPLTSKAQYDKVSDVVDSALAQGGRIHTLTGTSGALAYGTVGLACNWSGTGWRDRDGCAGPLNVTHDGSVSSALVRGGDGDVEPTTESQDVGAVVLVMVVAQMEIELALRGDAAHGPPANGPAPAAGIVNDHHLVVG